MNVERKRPTNLNEFVKLKVSFTFLHNIKQHLSLYCKNIYSTFICSVSRGHAFKSSVFVFVICMIWPLGVELQRQRSSVTLNLKGVKYNLLAASNINTKIFFYP